MPESFLTIKQQWDLNHELTNMDFVSVKKVYQEHNANIKIISFKVNQHIYT
jgi:hypothetical protein